MKIGQMMESKFLKKEDCDPAVLVTIRGFSQQNAGRDDAPDMKWTMSFVELHKPMVMNSTNLQLCAQALGTDETDEWIGKKVVLYNDPSVQFQGKLIGGIRIRAPKKRPVVPGNAYAPQPAPQPMPVRAEISPAMEEEFDDEIPFDQAAGPRISSGHYADPRGDAKAHANPQRVNLYVREFVACQHKANIDDLMVLWEEMKQDTDTTIVVWDVLKRQWPTEFSWIKGVLKP